MYKLNNENNISNTDLSLGKWSCFAIIARGGSLTSYKMAKKKESKWVTEGGNKEIFFITFLGMRVDPSLLVFNLCIIPGYRRVKT